MTEATATAPRGDRDSRVDGAVDALRRSVLAIKDTPELVVVFVVVAPLAALLGSICGIGFRVSRPFRRAVGSPR